MSKEVAFAGFGGQGVLTAGYLFTEMVMKTGAAVTYMPAYGAEMRGGSASCCVKFDPERVGTPLMQELDLLVAMNIPSMNSLEKIVKPGGIMIVNSDIIDTDEFREDITVLKVPCQSIAAEVNNARGGNLVMLGVTVYKTAIGEIDYATQVLCEYFDKKGKSKYNAANEAALRAGYEYAKSL